jgi:hypothetical protein
LFERGLVLDASAEAPHMQGTISWGSRSIKTAANILPDHSCENLCPCRDNVERGIICAHVIALGLALLARNSDPDRERKLQEEERRRGICGRSKRRRSSSARRRARPAR